MERPRLLELARGFSGEVEVFYDGQLACGLASIELEVLHVESVRLSG